MNYACLCMCEWMAQTHYFVYYAHTEACVALVPFSAQHINNLLNCYRESLQEHLPYILRTTRPIVIFFLLFSGRSYRHIWKQKLKGLYSNPSKYKFGLTWNCDRNILLNVMIVQLLLLIIKQLLLKHYFYYLKKITINIFLWKLINLRCVWLLQFNETIQMQSIKWMENT